MKIFPSAAVIATVLATIVAVSCTSASVTGPTESLPKCEVGITSPQHALNANGGSASLSIVAAPECQWSAESDESWISNLAPPSGQGPAELQFSATPNPAGVMRQGEITVNGAVVKVSQEPAPCTFDVSPRTLTVASAASNGSVTVTSPSGCSWTAKSDVGWISLTTPAEGSGGGGVNFDVAANPTTNPRIGSLTIAGHAVLVTQQAPGCSYAVSPPAQTVGSGGGPGAVAVTTAASCGWTASADVSWITFSGNPGGQGNANVGFTVAANGGAQRTGRINVAGVVATVTQDAAANCTYTVSPSAQQMVAGGGTFTVAVTTTAACGWSAGSGDSWVQVSPATSTGSGNAQVTVAENTGAARSSQALTVAGHTVTVNQDAAAAPPPPPPPPPPSPPPPSPPPPSPPPPPAPPPPAPPPPAPPPPPACTYVLSPSSASVGGGSGSSSVEVDTQANCAWTVSTATSWLSVAGGASRSGPGKVEWQHDANPLLLPRSGTLSIAGQTFSVAQSAGAICSFTFTPSSASFDEKKASGEFTVTASSPLCPWVATSTASWVDVRNGGVGLGNGRVRYEVERNRTNSRRTATIVIAGQAFTITQDNR